MRVENKFENITDKQEIEQLRIWMRFLTGNSTNKREIIKKIDIGYREEVRNLVADQIVEYMEYLDELEDN